MRLQDKIRKEGTVLRRERVIMANTTEPILVGEDARQMQARLGSERVGAAGSRS
jgi:hypothetical protein